MLTTERLREVLHYDPLAGLLTWKKPTSNRVKVGSVVKCRDTHGYPIARIDGTLYLAHRLAFLYMVGRFPKHDIDHVDGNRANNAWANLREATRQENHRNRTPKNGVKGIQLMANGKWRARITVSRQGIHLGCFSNSDDAMAAYAKAADKYFGAFSRIP